MRVNDATQTTPIEVDTDPRKRKSLKASEEHLISPSATLTRQVPAQKSRRLAS